MRHGRLPKCALAAAVIAASAVPHAGSAAPVVLPGVRVELRERPSAGQTCGWEVYLLGEGGQARSIGAIERQQPFCLPDWSVGGVSRGKRAGEYVLHVARRIEQGDGEPSEESEDLSFRLGPRLDDPEGAVPVLAYPVGCGDGRPESGREACEEVGLLGFSDGGKIAYTYPAQGGPRIAVRNLVSDAAVADVPASLPAADVGRLLRKERIRTTTRVEACAEGPFSAFVDGDGIVFSRRGEVKRVARLPPGSAGFEPRVLGCLRSPFEPRVAVFYEVAGPDGRAMVLVAGAHLEAGFSSCGAGWCTPCSGSGPAYEDLSVRRKGCGIGPGGALTCWGALWSGHAPPSAGSPHPTRWIQVAVGADFACAIGDDSSLWCFAASAPRRIGTARWKKVAAGAASDGHPPDHFCGIQEDGSMWCWGDWRGGRPARHVTPFDEPPARVGDASDWTDVAAGARGSCGIRTPGALHCWGYGGPTIGALRRIGEADDWVRVRVGGRHVCGLRASGALLCFGRYVQAGIQPPDDNPTWDTWDPVRVGDARYTTVATGDEHSCAIREDGTLWCWGFNHRGQLGRGHVASAARPEQVGSSAGWLDVWAGSSETCGRRADGVWCFGSDTYVLSPAPPRWRQLCSPAR